MTYFDKSIGEEKTVVSEGTKTPDLSPGQMLGQYKIIKLLGAGFLGQNDMVMSGVIGKCTKVAERQEEYDE
jgi:hypothetical protein